MKKYLFIFLILTTIIISCTIKQEYHFNKDFSGTSKTTIDLGMFINLMKGLDSTGKSGNIFDSIGHSLNKAIAELEKNGAKNVKYSWNNEKTVLSLSYDFPNIKVLNQALSSTDLNSDKMMGKSGTKSKTYFEVKGKNLIYHSAKVESDTIFKADQMKSMGQYYQFELVFSFEKKVKSVNNPNAIIMSDGKSVQLKGNLFDMLSPKYNSDIEFKLK